MTATTPEPIRDPRELKGSIAGPGGPQDRKAVVIDTQRAVLLESVDVVKVEPRRDGQPQPPCLAMVLSGRVNRTNDLAEVLFLFDVDGAAAIITELLALAERMDVAELVSTIQTRLDHLNIEGARR